MLFRHNMQFIGRKRLIKNAANRINAAREILSPPFPTGLLYFFAFKPEVPFTHSPRCGFVGSLHAPAKNLTALPGFPIPLACGVYAHPGAL